MPVVKIINSALTQQDRMKYILFMMFTNAFYANFHFLPLNLFLFFFSFTLLNSSQNNNILLYTKIPLTVLSVLKLLWQVVDIFTLVLCKLATISLEPCLKVIFQPFGLFKRARQHQKKFTRKSTLNQSKQVIAQNKQETNLAINITF